MNRKVEGLKSMLWALESAHASIHGDRLTGDVAGCVGSEQHGDALEVVVASEPAQWCAVEDELAALVDRSARHLGGKYTGRDRIRSDPVAGPLHRNLACKVHDAAF